MTGSVKVRLTWSAHPRDLDLHVVRLGDMPDGVNFRRTAAPGLRYEGDVTTGWGPEVAHVLVSGVYRVGVHHYTGAGRLAASEAVVEIMSKDAGLERRVQFQAPTDLTGDWWWPVQLVVTETGGAPED